MERKIVLGLTERITLRGPKKSISVIARIDTGATTSSLDTELAQRLNLEPTSHTRIVRSAHGVRKRPLLKAHLQLQGQSLEADFTLADRKHLKYPVLIGQNILKKGNFLIDPQQSVHS